MKTNYTRAEVTNILLLHGYKPKKLARSLMFMKGLENHEYNYYSPEKQTESYPSFLRFDLLRDCECLVGAIDCCFTLSGTLPL
jgi:hypothetical protein